MTKHKADCKMVFGRKDDTCPRCIEMLNGSPPRDGWQKYYYSKKKRDELNRLAAIKYHFTDPNSPHNQGKCGPVCTAFDW